MSADQLQKALRPVERDRIRAHLDGALALARERGRWRACRDAILCRVLLDTGIRVHEACALRRSDARVDGGDRRLNVRRGKGGRRRDVRLPEDLRAELRQYLAATPSDDTEAPLFPRGNERKTDTAIQRVTAWRIWKAALRAVGLDARGRGCHAARHGLGLALYQSTKDLRLVAAQLGHTDLRSTMIYTAPLPEDVDAALDAVSRSSATGAGPPKVRRGAR
jgi:integrase/recombinase XerD